MDYTKDLSPEPVHRWHEDPNWRSRRLSPAQIQVHDIRLEGSRQDVGAMLEMREVLSSALLPHLERRDDLANSLLNHEAAKNRSEIRSLVQEFGWLNVLRDGRVQETIHDPQDLRKYRWIHISTQPLHQPTRALLTKHGKYFAPFYQHLRDAYDSADTDEHVSMLLSVPFLDWAVDAEKTPPLRFQIDPREGYQSAQSSSHLLRSILQYFYRLEDTSDREAQQIFTKHKPWKIGRNLDLKVQRFYGHRPTVLNVDELWILVIDSRDIPPLQVSARIAEVSFRGMRNSLINKAAQDSGQDYTSSLHVVAALSGALGLMHRSFWTDITLCLSDRYASYLSHLQCRLLRSPSSKLVMDLLQVQEELNIIISIMEQQMELITSFKEDSLPSHNRPPPHPTLPHNPATPVLSPLSHPQPSRTYRQISLSRLANPTAQLLQNLNRKYADFLTLRHNTNALITRTIQLVNMRLEDHGKAILVFTIVTIIFLPLSFVSSFVGMNFAHLRDMQNTQRLFWIVAGALTVGTVSFSLILGLAFYAGDVMEWFVSWRQNRRRRLKRR